jgi:hypothetical protein
MKILALMQNRIGFVSGHLLIKKGSWIVLPYGSLPISARRWALRCISISLHHSQRLYGSGSGWVSPVHLLVLYRVGLWWAVAHHDAREGIPTAIRSRRTS